MKKYLIFICLSFFVIVILLFSFSVFAVSPTDYGLKEGDLISAIFSDDPDVYIINEDGFKRVFLNPEIFDFYEHLGGFFNVKLVTQEVRDSFPTSGLFRNCEDNDEKVYGVDIDGEDTGQLHWVNTSGEQAVQDDPDFFKKVFCINKKELNWYPRGDSLNTVKDVPKYDRIKEAESVSTEKKLEAKTELKDIGQAVICHHPSDSAGVFQTITISASALKTHLDHGDTVGACFAPTPIVPTIPTIPASPSLPFSPTPLSTPIFTPAPIPTPTPLYSSGTCIGFNLTPNKTTFLPLETLSYTISCTSGYEPFTRVEIRKSDNTFTGSEDLYSISSVPKTVNTGLGDRPVGSYILRACFDTVCQKIAASVPFNIVSSLVSTPISTSTTPTLTTSPMPTTTASSSATPTPVSTSSPQATPTPTPTVTTSAGSGNSTLTATRLFIGQYDNTKYSITVNDPDGIWEFLIGCNGVCANYGQATFFGGGGVSSSCSTSSTSVSSSTVTLNSSDFPINGYVIDCKNSSTKYTIQAPMPALPTPTPTPTPTPVSTALCTGLSSTLNDNKSGIPPAYIRGLDTVASFSWFCLPSGSSSSSITVKLYKPDGTSSTLLWNVSSNFAHTYGFAISSDSQTGIYTFVSCLDTSCSGVVTTQKFQIVDAPTPTPTTGSTSYDFTRDLYFGLQGNDVKQLQALLVNEVNYSANLLTGYFGNITREAVKRLQVKYGIKPVFGYFGEITRRTLRALIKP
ncbi:MAG: peptidoglycan-binding protein [Parcubacteria group bacterium]|nr:peptidoglycan-binding protein [Parcubacteria group bacterium]